ncbi:molybdopterin synthase sulfur carrier subunit [Hypericibacter terrae]|jgi:sulfur-carrier protein|uniref:Molybdopterin synthase sulfur carrier subunit n=1 Tax=Hypericibacter terrae TaxID=2602015 RepID=A0A5J6ME99_9PROT|nr:molybdopterin converting factor subunit 1 [Hypericibacter terrae]QEX15689.1 molybdopterin synthase sulfur carrier subunit [Hypericibacter terrae]
MKLLYFALFRARIGCGEEELAPPAEVKTVGALVDWLAQRGPGYRAALADRKLVRVAVNQDYVDFDHPVAANDEVALFPPVTGG